MKQPKRIRLGPETDLGQVLSDFDKDNQPRIVERDGREVAAIISVEDLARLLEPAVAPEARDKALAAAGTWRDLDAEEFKRSLYRSRHESPPSRLVSL
jgi:hypothetical protein